MRIIKKLTLILILLNSNISAQQLETIYINTLVSTHFVMSEPIQYVDISSDKIAGDMPVENILRLKPQNQDDSDIAEQGIVTIVCQKYMVQYALVHADINKATKSKFISSKDGMGLLLPEITISAEEMKAISWKVLELPDKKPLHQIRQKGMKVSVNKVYVSGDYYFLDLSIKNRTSIPFEIDHLRFSVQDKRVLKATNHQQVDLEPEFRLYTQQRIRRDYRNVFVFKKFTFPNEKILQIELAEKQLSGRTIQIQLDYKTILNAEPI